MSCPCKVGGWTETVSILCMSWWTSSLACCGRRMRGKDGGPIFWRHNKKPPPSTTAICVGDYFNEEFIVCSKSGWIVIWIWHKVESGWEPNVLWNILVSTCAFPALCTHPCKIIMSGAAPHRPCPQHLCVCPWRGCLCFLFLFVILKEWAKEKL